MISATQNVQKILYNSSAIKIGTGCLLEYNMNNMLDNITVEYDSSLTYPSVNNINVYKKLFPVDSIIKPFRPINSGIKYYITLGRTLHLHMILQQNNHFLIIKIYNTHHL